jgi:hypothetical protein
VRSGTETLGTRTVARTVGTTNVTRTTRGTATTRGTVASRRRTKVAEKGPSALSARAEATWRKIAQASVEAKGPSRAAGESEQVLVVYVLCWPNGIMFS